MQLVPLRPGVGDGRGVGARGVHVGHRFVRHVAAQAPHAHLRPAQTALPHHRGRHEPVARGAHAHVHPAADAGARRGAVYTLNAVDP